MVGDDESRLAGERAEDCKRSGRGSEAACNDKKCTGITYILYYSFMKVLPTLFPTYYYAMFIYWCYYAVVFKIITIGVIKLIVSVKRT